ncbi:hypothetical protein [Paraburkholderia silvatlantica]|uniref:Uncharacterized protein n=1 Tax=Paraburkholderia silvatlantica TaxID=321895 RepID=A0ABR6FK02_9BURK|nr:hypothetical protein [Paraburkholderia silvatlantica]MBB2927755.1 hypothetical protein [Paraburkholderia silvatlantica]
MGEIEWAWGKDRLHQQAKAHERQARQQYPVCNLVPMKFEPEGQHDAHSRAQGTGATERENFRKVWPEHRTGLCKADFPKAKTHPDQGSEHQRRTAKVGEAPAILLRKFPFDLRILEPGGPAKHIDQPCANRAGRMRAFEECRFRRRLKPEYAHRISPVCSLANEAGSTSRA